MDQPLFSPNYKKILEAIQRDTDRIATALEALAIERGAMPGPGEKTAD